MHLFIKLITFLLLFLNTLHADCYDLDYDDCLYWSGFCEWNESTKKWEGFNNNRTTKLAIWNGSSWDSV